MKMNDVRKNSKLSKKEVIKMKHLIYCNKANINKKQPYLFKFFCRSDNYNGYGYDTSFAEEEYLNLYDEGKILNGKIVASFELDEIVKCRDISSKYAYLLYMKNVSVFDIERELREFYYFCDKHNCSKCENYFYVSNESVEFKDTCLSNFKLTLERVLPNFCLVYDKIKNEEYCLWSVHPERVCYILNGVCAVMFTKRIPKILKNNLELTERK